MVSSFDRTNAGLDFNDVNKRRECVNVFAHQAAPMDAFLSLILQEGQSTLEINFARGVETKLVQLCNLFVHISTDPRLLAPSQGDTRCALPGCMKWASRSYRMFHMYLPPRPPVVLHPRVAEFDLQTFPPPANVRELRETIYTSISSARNDMCCLAVGCTNSFQSSGKNFMRCGRCSIVSYCSKQCQTRAWRDEKFPHERVCPLLRHLTFIAGEIPFWFPGASISGTKMGRCEDS
ncbi:hypothetical protein C8J57DRAFT_149388 [Mycena rebaudengoi]|nr:hypothetical protein C8J57DRAFT_149388 [Mycena rebaudengoi]